MNKPNLSRDQIEALLRPQLNQLPADKYPLVAFGIRGLYAKNKRGVWDDGIGWLDRRTGAFLIFNGNTDPTASFKQGLGCIFAPQILWFKIGKHRGRPAFRQAATFKVMRDGVGLVDAPESCAFNWHDALGNTTSSLGCQTQPRDQFAAAREFGYAMVPKYYRDQKFPYILVEPTHEANERAIENASRPPEVTQDCLDLIMKFEGCRLEAYQDPVGIWTIGWGTVKGVKPGMKITQALADKLLREEVNEKANQVLKLVRVPLNNNQFGALVSFAYNVGTGQKGLAGSTLLKKLNSGDMAGAAAEFARWNKAGGKVLAGLTRRRAAEAKLFLS